MKPIKHQPIINSKTTKELKETIKNDERFDMQEMISLKSLVKYVKEAKITPPKKGVETPLDAKVQIPGFGVMTEMVLHMQLKRLLSLIECETLDYCLVFWAFFGQQAVLIFMESLKVYQKQ